jgi:hypothetical protein
MEPQIDRKPARRPSTMGWLEYVIGGSAVLISAISLQVALNANQTQERLLAASTWPHVQYGTGNRLDDGTSSITFNLYNAGVGPARIQSMQLLYGGQPMPDAATLLRACCAASGTDITTVTSHPERVLVPGEEVVFLRYDAASADPAVWQTLNRERFAVQVRACFCSVLDDCWMVAPDLGEPQPVAAARDRISARLPPRARWRACS